MLLKKQKPLRKVQQDINQDVIRQKLKDKDLMPYSKRWSEKDESVFQNLNNFINLSFI